MCLTGQVPDQFLHMAGDLGPLMKLLGDRIGLFSSRNLTSEEEPNQGFRCGLPGTSRAFEGRESLLELRDGHTTETDTLIDARVEECGGGGGRGKRVMMIIILMVMMI